MERTQPDNLILDYRPLASRFARSFARRWRYMVEDGELESLSDLALCEAANAYCHERNCRFSSYLFVHVRRVVHASLCQTIRYKKRFTTLASREDQEDSDNRGHPVDDAFFGAGSPSPEVLFTQTEAREDLLRAFDVLEDRERKIVAALFVEELSMTRTARHLALSRVHLYTLRERALFKMRLAFGRRTPGVPGGHRSEVRDGPMRGMAA